MYIKTALDADDPGISKAIFSDRTAEVHVYQKLLFDAGVQAIFKARFSDRTAEVYVYQKQLFDADGTGIFKAIFSDRTAEVHVYQKLLFDAGGPGIFKAIFSDRAAEVHVYQNCSLMRMVQVDLKQYSVIEQRRFMYIKKLLFDADSPDIFKPIFSDRTAEIQVYKNCSLMRMV